MKTFILRTTLIGLLIFCTIALGEIICRSNKSNLFYEKSQYISNHGDEISTLILGSSHAHCDIAAHLLADSAYNLALGGQLLRYDWHLLKHYQSHLANLRHIILTISAFSFRDGMTLVQYNWHKISYKRYLKIPFYSDFSRYNFICTYMPLYRTMLKEAIWPPIPSDPSLRGWQQKHIEQRSETWNTIESHDAAKRHNHTENTYVTENIAYLENIMQYCQSHNIRLSLVTTPTFHTYQEHINTEQLDEMHTILQQLELKYTFDYHNYLYDNRFTSDDYFDTDHLTSTGAIKFTDILHHDLTLPQTYTHTPAHTPHHNSSPAHSRAYRAPHP